MDFSESNIVCCKIITVKAAYCVSVGKVVSDVMDIGTISDVWKAIPFQFSLQNLSEAPLVCKFDRLPPEITLDEGVIEREKKHFPILACDNPRVEEANPQLNAIVRVPSSSTMLINAMLNPSEVLGGRQIFFYPYPFTRTHPFIPADRRRAAGQLPVQLVSNQYA